MRYGFYLPTRGSTANRDGILALAREGERLGLHSAMIADHIVLPVENRSSYPYTVDGKHPSLGDALETSTACTSEVERAMTFKTSLVAVCYFSFFRRLAETAAIRSTVQYAQAGFARLSAGGGEIRAIRPQ